MRKPKLKVALRGAAADIFEGTKCHEVRMGGVPLGDIHPFLLITFIF